MDIKAINEKLNNMPLWMVLLIVLAIGGVGAGVSYVVMDSYDKTPHIRHQVISDRPVQNNTTGESLSAGVYFEPQNLTEATRVAAEADLTPLPTSSASPAANVAKRYPDQEESIDMQAGVNTGKPADARGFFDSLGERLAPASATRETASPMSATPNAQSPESPAN